MATVEIRDYALWIKHIHGDDGLVARLAAMSEGEVIELTAEGHRGLWKKMANGADRRETPGFKALGEAKTHWHQLFRTRRGDMVSLSNGGTTLAGEAPAVAVSAGREGMAKRLMAVARAFAPHRGADARTPDEALGYDEFGLPH